MYTSQCSALYIECVKWGGIEISIQHQSQSRDESPAFLHNTAINFYARFEHSVAATSPPSFGSMTVRSFFLSVEEADSVKPKNLMQQANIVFKSHPILLTSTYTYIYQPQPI